jgi:Fic/DOC family
LAAFESTLQRAVAGLDAKVPQADFLDDDGLSAVIELAARVHAQWVRIHPFANGNGRSLPRVGARFLLRRQSHGGSQEEGKASAILTCRPTRARQRRNVGAPSSPCLRFLREAAPTAPATPA